MLLRFLHYSISLGRIVSLRKVEKILKLSSPQKISYHRWKLEEVSITLIVLKTGDHYGIDDKKNDAQLATIVDSPSTAVPIQSRTGYQVALDA